jgi:hypothetical protein
MNSVNLFGFDLTIKRQSKRLREFGPGVSIQHLGDLLLQLEAYQSDSNNKYITREMQVTEAVRKYRGMAAKGNVLTRNLVETRSTFTAGRGLSVDWEGEAEKAFIAEFQRVNRLKLSYVRQLARERSFEGQVLLVLQPHADGVPRVRFLSWLDSRYEVVAAANDYTQIDRVEMMGSRFEIPPERIAFMKFSTRLTSMEGVPLLAGVLDKLEDLDDALNLLKTANKASANPTPYFEFPIEDDAKEFQTRLTELAWKMGTPLAGSGKATMLQMGYGSYTSLTEQVQTLARIISGHTAVPPHYFGFPDLVGNRSIADSMADAFVQVAECETEEWAAGFTDLIGRAMALHNTWTGAELNHQAGVVQIENISEEDFRRIAAIWLPLWLGGAITTETFLNKVPMINEEAEAQAVMAEMVERGVDLGIGRAVTPGEVVPQERKVALDAMKTYGSTRAA